MVAADGKLRQLLCIPLRKLNGWLFSINPERVRADIKDKLIQYQEECFSVLHEYWNKGEVKKKSRQSTATQLTPLRQTAERLITTGLGKIYPDIWKLVHQRFDIEHIHQLQPEQIGEAVEFLNVLEGQFMGKQLELARGRFDAVAVGLRQCFGFELKDVVFAGSDRSGGFVSRLRVAVDRRFRGFHQRVGQRLIFLAGLRPRTVAEHHDVAVVLFVIFEEVRDAAVGQASRNVGVLTFAELHHEFFQRILIIERKPKIQPVHVVTQEGVFGHADDAVVLVNRVIGALI